MTADPAPDLAPLSRALISVSDKSGLHDFARSLHARGVEILSTGGTAHTLRAAGIPVTEVSDVTDFPEILDGRVKTLHPRIHGGLLARRDDSAHLAAMADHGIAAIDLVVVNLYPFARTVAEGGDARTCIENIDIGGPAMIRAAAKNHAFVSVITDVSDYDALLAELDAHDGRTTLAFRRRLARTAYETTAAYDAAVSGWMAGEAGDAQGPMPRHRVICGTLARGLRYGENPHQRAAFYTDGSARPGVATAQQHQGKALSYNNINDTDAAFELVAEFDPADGPACVIVKHAGPCGVARADTLRDAYAKALDCDRTSAFGGIVALNHPLDAATATEIARTFTEVVIAPDAGTEAKRLLAGKANLRLLTTGGLPSPDAPATMLRQVAGGFLAQDRDVGHIVLDALKVVTQRAPSPEELRDLLFAWTVARHVRSNAIVCVKGGATVGIGAGQASRLDSVNIAIAKAERMAGELGLPHSPVIGSAVASDAFFPFADGVIGIAGAGASAIIQPGGSKRDDQVIRAADEAGLAMVFTGMRHFRH